MAKITNVMFELGMRLAFDKPTIIIKDDCTSYSFDTSPIEHLEYPRDLNYAKINAFKEQLAAKIKILLDASKEEGAYSPFLKHFGTFTVAKIDQKEVSGQDYIVGQLEEISKRIGLLERDSITQMREDSGKANSYSRGIYSIRLPIKLTDEELIKFLENLKKLDITVVDFSKNQNAQQTISLFPFKQSVEYIDRLVDNLLVSIQKTRKNYKTKTVNKN